MTSVSNMKIFRTFTLDGIELKGQRQVIHNSPFGTFDNLCDEPVVFVQLDDSMKVIDEAVAKKLAEPVTIEGKSYRVDLLWGSGVKRGQLIGVQQSLIDKVKDMFRFVEDSYRFKRAIMPSSRAAYRGKLRVLALPIGTIVGNLKIEDGFGYVRQSLVDEAESGLNKPVEKTKYGSWRTSYTFMQRFSFNDALWSELKPVAEKSLSAINDSGFFMFSEECDSKEKVALLQEVYDSSTEAGNDVISHPYFSSTFINAWSLAAFSLATTAGLKMQGGVFVPTTSDDLVLPDDERFGDGTEFVITRYPIDAESSIRAVKREMDAAETARITALETCQFTITDSSLTHSFKGVSGVIADAEFSEKFGDYDVVVAVDDLKLCAEWHTAEDIDSYKAQDRVEFAFGDAMYCVTAWYAAGSAIGVPSLLAKKLGADYDGDAGAVLSGSEFPEIYRQAQGFGDVANPKLPKTKTATDFGGSHAMNALKSMANIVGMATNISSIIESYPDKALLSQRLGFKSVEDMGCQMQFAIKIGTDIFKTSADYRPSVKMLENCQRNLKALGIFAPWVHWKGDVLAFRKKLPTLMTEYEVMALDKDDHAWELKNNLRETATGIIAEIARRVLPMIVMPPMANVMPLANFKMWGKATTTNEQLETLIKRWLTTYGLQVQSMNFSIGDKNEEDWADFAEQARNNSDWLCGKFPELSRYEVAQAVWYYNHANQSTRNANKIASLVFVAFPEEAVRIILEKPGMADVVKKQVESVEVVGVKYALPNYTNHLGRRFQCIVVQFVQEKAGETIVRKGITSLMPMEGQQENEGFPQNFVGILPMDSTDQAVLEPGSYYATLTETNKRVYAQLQAA